MKKLMIISAAVATLAVAAPAAAQVRVEAGPGGVEVGVGHRHHHWREGYAAGHCRYERTEVTTPSGRVIVKKRRICD